MNNLQHETNNHDHDHIIILSIFILIIAIFMGFCIGFSTKKCEKEKNNTISQKETMNIVKSYNIPNMTIITTNTNKKNKQDKIIIKKTSNTTKILFKKTQDYK